MEEEQTLFDLRLCSLRMHTLAYTSHTQIQHSILTSQIDKKSAGSTDFTCRSHVSMAIVDLLTRMLTGIADSQKIIISHVLTATGIAT